MSSADTFGSEEGKEVLTVEATLRRALDAGKRTRRPKEALAAVEPAVQSRHTGSSQPKAKPKAENAKAEEKPKAEEKAESRRRQARKLTG